MTENVVLLCAEKFNNGWLILCWSVFRCIGAVDFCYLIIVSLFRRVFEVFAFIVCSMAKSGSLYLVGLSFLRVVKSSNSSSLAWCYIPARWMMPKLYLDKRRRQRAGLPDESTRLSIHLSASWLVRIVKR